MLTVFQKELTPMSATACRSLRPPFQANNQISKHMTQIKRSFTLAVLAASLLLQSAGCTRQPPAPGVVTFGVDTFSLASAPVLIADEKGFWKGEKVAVSIKPFASGSLAVDALVAHAVDTATVADLPVVFAAQREPTIRIVATFSDSDKHVNMLGRKDRGIKTPADLKGKKIAVTVGTAAEYVMDQFLQNNHIPKSAVTVISLPPPDTVPAIVRGDVDAIVAWQPNILNAQKQLGSNAVTFPSGDIYSQPFNVAVLDNFSQQNPAAIVALLRGIRRAEEFIKTNKAESIAIVARRLGLDPHDLAQIWDDYSFQLNLPARLPSAMAAEDGWARAEGLIRKDAKAPDYSTIVNAQFFQDIQ